MQNIQIARIAHAAEVSAAGGSSWDELSEDQRNRLIESAHRLREDPELSDGTIFDETAIACLAEGDMLADDFDGQAVEVRNGALAYALQHVHGGKLTPSTHPKPEDVTAAAATFEAYLRDGAGNGKS